MSERGAPAPAIPSPFPAAGREIAQRTIRAGITLGAAIAVAVSYGANKSVAWAVLHGMLGWFYVVYALVFGDASCAGSP